MRKKDDILEILAIRFFGIIFAVIGIPSTIYCFQNHETVTTNNWIASIIFGVRIDI